MNNYVTRFTRTGAIRCTAAIEEIFPLLCPKREEEWIPGWECEVIWSNSGYNEEGAVFRTQKPFGTELYWTTVAYDISQGRVEFFITAPHLYIFRFTIILTKDEADGIMTLQFSHEFTSLSEAGHAFVEDYKSEDFKGRLKGLEELLNRHLKTKQTCT